MINEIKNKKWEKIYTRPFSVQRQEGPIKCIAKLGLKNFLIIPSNKEELYDWYIIMDQMKKFTERIEETIFDKKKFDDHIAKHREGAEEMIKILKKDYTKISWEEMKNIYKKFIDIFTGEFSTVYAVPWGLDDFTIPNLQKELKKELGKENTEKEWEIIGNPTEIIAIQKIQIEISKLFIEGKLDNEINKLVEKYEWLTVYDFYDKQANERYIKSLVLGKSKKEIEEKINQIKKEIEENKKEFNALLDKIDNERLKQGLYAINFYIAFRAERMDSLRRILMALKPFYERVVKELKTKDEKWEFYDVVNLTNDELLKIFEEEIPQVEEIKKRMDLKAYHYYNNGQYNLVSEHATEIDKLLKKDNETTNELKGTSAFKGKAKGICRIIQKYEDIGKLKEGEILISSMTKPDFVPAMKLASAFVTDEGSITCHAAIIARELKKPCIIGTKTATHILKDGMLIEVDANKGVIKIIK